MRVAISADTRNFDAAMKHVRGQAAQARRAVAPTLGAMGMGGAGRMAGMGIGMAAMSGPMGAIAAATAAVAMAVNAIKERRESQDQSFREIVESGLSPEVHAQLSAIAKMAAPSARSADMVELMRSFREMGDQQRLDMSSTLGPDLMKALREGTGAEFVNAIRQAQRQDPDFASGMGGKASALIRALSLLDGSDVARAFSATADLGGSGARERARIEGISPADRSADRRAARAEGVSARELGSAVRQRESQRQAADAARTLEAIERMARNPV